MRVSLIACLSALTWVCLTSVLAADRSSNLPTPPTPPTAATNSVDPVEAAYEALLEQDNAAAEEVDRWIRADQKRMEDPTASTDVTLRARIQERFRPVRQAYESFLKEHPNHARARLAYGSFLLETGDDEEAVRQMEKARETDPRNPAAWNNLANYYGHDGPVEKAFEYYAKAIELNPREPVYLQNLATVVFLFRRDATNFYRITEWEVFEKSLDLYRQAIRLDPTNFLLASEYAQSFYGVRVPADGEATLRDQRQQKVYQDAIAAWEQAQRLASDDLQRQGVALHLARVHLLANHFDDAQRHLDLVSVEAYRDTKQRIQRNLTAKREKAATNNPPATLPQ